MEREWIESGEGSEDQYELLLLNLRKLSVNSSQEFCDLARSLFKNIFFIFISKEQDEEDVR